MFGNSEWFADSTNQRILRPAEKNGWIYYGAWLAAIALPTMILLTVGIPQAIFWMAISSVGFVWDYRRTLSNKRETQAYDKLFFIGDEQEVVDAQTTGETAEYEIEIKS